MTKSAPSSRPGSAKPSARGIHKEDKENRPVAISTKRPIHVDTSVLRESSSNVCFLPSRKSFAEQNHGDIVGHTNHVDNPMLGGKLAQKKYAKKVGYVPPSPVQDEKKFSKKAAYKGLESPEPTRRFGVRVFDANRGSTENIILNPPVVPATTSIKFADKPADNVNIFKTSSPRAQKVFLLPSTSYVKSTTPSIQLKVEPNSSRITTSSSAKNILTWN